MVRAIEEQATSTAATALGFDERLSMLVQCEVAWRDDRRLQRLLKAAKLKVSTACVENIDWRASRTLDRSLVAALAGGDWIRNAQNLLITGATVQRCNGLRQNVAGVCTGPSGSKVRFLGAVRASRTAL